MSSPFPGMDPYIEECGLWEDFHNHVIEKISEYLADCAPDHYFVSTGERPDVLLVEIDEEHREKFVEIYETLPEQRLVTCIEVLSPTNKRPNSPGWDLYERKRTNLLLGHVHLVEIDLLRGGERMPMLDPWPKSPYVIMVARAMKAQSCKAWPIHYHRPMPAIPVPLAKPDPDISLSLQPIIDGIYQRFRYQQRIDYTEPLHPPLSAKDADWLRQQLRTAAKRRER